MLTDERRAEIEARLADATEGPWAYEPYGMHGGKMTWITTNPTGRAGAIFLDSERDVAFMVHARADVPVLLAEVDRLRELVALCGVDWSKP